MGNQQNRRPLNPTEVLIPQQQQQSQQVQENQIENFLKEEFSKSSINGYIGKDKFNEALATLENFQIKRLRNTPLGERLFVLFDGNKANKVKESTCIENFSKLLKDKDFRIEYTFRAINKESNNKISRKEFQDFYEESWKAAFRILGERVQNQGKYSNIGLNKINNWATQQIPILNKEINQIYDDLDKNKRGAIDFSTFREWLKKCDIHSIIASFEDIEVEIPTDLYVIDVQK